MKIVIVYYSHYGNTATVADGLRESFLGYGETKLVEVKYLEHSPGILLRIIYRLFPEAVPIAPVELDLQPYDLVCFAVPVRGGKPSVPITRYIKLCSNLSGKKILCCYVYSIELSAHACANFIKKLFARRGSGSVIDMFIPWEQVHNKPHLEALIAESIKKLTL